MFLMKCGHMGMATCSRSGGVEFDPPIPACVICAGEPESLIIDKEVTGTEGIEERKAKCAYCGTVEQSTWELAFYEYRGKGSNRARTMCTCGYYEVAHEKPNMHIKLKCQTFEPHGEYEFDDFYCSCRGWD